ncbi:8-oxo-dGTP diphosphatase [Metalysinibacillus saudimassiliensis]|uniref:8-oxo-dGTP diphosphatase n=1 Tax=Metalysinibacillus saudimassiliensis TaxID=1461583 RepID=A0A078MK93_9BACL|nr:8-oxo-dGTP diphosphatase [Metalysinibacillus saudimassiliensis]
MKHIGVGVDAFILNEHNELLLVRRKKEPEAAHWSLPGGKVELMETIEDATVREIKEELGVTITLTRLLCVTNHILPPATHSVAPTFIKNRREYSHLKEREGRSPVSRWEMNRLRTRGSLLAISIVRLFEC